jgi:Protein of unknown function (DUF3224)
MPSSARSTRRRFDAPCRWCLAMLLLRRGDGLNNSHTRIAFRAMTLQAQHTAHTMSSTTRRAIVQAAVLLPIGAFARGTNRMSHVAKGSFTVEMKPQGESNATDGVTTGRMSLSKRFEGDLVAVGQGEMLTALTPVKGSAGYVAIERVTGALHGRAGSFVFQHSGTMNQGAQQLSIRVVPGSGTGSLSGIEGVFKLDIVEGRHLYEFEYTLP